MSNPIFNSVKTNSNSNGICSYAGTISCLALFFVLFTISFSYSWQLSTEGLAESFKNIMQVSGEKLSSVPVNSNCINLIVGGSIIGFFLGLITIFNPNWSLFTGGLYSLAQGISLGAITAYAESKLPGIACKTIGITFLTFIGCFTLYSTGIFKVTEGFYKFILVSMFGILGIYFSNFILNFFGSYIPIVEGNHTAALIFQIFIVIIAALNFMLDFNEIENNVESGGPVYLNSYNAFGLMVTFVWLYIEILDLLLKLKSASDD
jgi:uncharacterized YccA/Bax inhibitor family protein